MASIAVSGATGALGGRIAERLAASGTPQRLLVRDPARAPSLEGAEIASASSYGAEDEMRAALEGIETLCMISARESPDRVEEHLSAIRAAVGAGVRRIVYTSVLSAAPDATFTFARDHWATEEAIRESGLAFTFLRDTMYLDYVPLLAGPDREFRGPAGDGRSSFVSRDDVADAAVGVLVAGGDYDGETFDVTGPELFDLAGLAERMTAYTGDEYRYKLETVEEAWESRRSLGFPEWALAGMISSYEAVADGSGEVLSDAVERLAGHPAQTLEQGFDAHPELLTIFDQA